MSTQFLFDLFDEKRAERVIEKVKSQKVTLRPYQREAVDAAYKQWDQLDARSTIVVLPTGTGKSVVFSEVMRLWDVATRGKILLIAHRTELILQAVGHAKRAGLTSGIEMASRYAKGKEDVIVASVQSLNASTRCQACYGEGCDFCSDGKIKRFTRFNPRDFGLITIDEAHHAVADSYRNVLTWFGQNPNQKTLLVTATPKRTDKKGMNNICDSEAYTMQLKTAIDEGWLVPIRQKFITVEGLDISTVKTSKGDLQQGQLEQAFLGLDEDEERMLHAVVKPTLMEANGQKTIVFASGKEHANKLAACFNANGVEAGVVTDDTDPQTRSELVDRFANADLQVLVNCMVFTEGFDAPKTAIVANCRPTKSESLYLQIIGRGTRPLFGVVDGPATAEERKAAIAASAKPCCVVLDFCGNSGEHKLVSVADVLAGEFVEPVDLAKAVEIAKSTGETLDTEELIEKVRQARKDAEARKEEERQQRLMTKTKADNATYSAVDVNLFRGDKFTTDGKYGEPATAKQYGFLRSLGYSKADLVGVTKSDASRMINNAKKRKAGVIASGWKSKIEAAPTLNDLHAIAKQIKDFTQNPKCDLDAAMIDSMRRSWQNKRATFVPQGD